jgi:hypothetical protein
MKHRVWKNIVPHTNFCEMDLSFLLYDNTMQSLRYIIDSTTLPDHHLAGHSLAKVLTFLQTTCGSIFSGQYFSGMGITSEETDLADYLIDLLTDWNCTGGNHYARRKLWKKLSGKQIWKNGFVQNLCDVQADYQFLLDIQQVYQRVFNAKPPLTALRDLGALQW